MSGEIPTPLLFPVFLRMEGRTALVVGGGGRAVEKVPALLDAGAHVRVVSPEIEADLVNLGVEYVPRRFRESDLDDAWYVVAAAPPEVNDAVARGAETRRLWVNAVDDVPNATAWLGAVLRRAGFTFAISSHAKAPALAALVRRGLERLLPDDLETWRALAEAQRDAHRRAGAPFPARRRALFEAIRGLYEPAAPPGAETGRAVAEPSRAPQRSPQVSP